MNIETKYEIGQELYFIANDRVKSDTVFRIKTILTKDYKSVYYSFNPKSATSAPIEVDQNFCSDSIEGLIEKMREKV